MRFPFHGLMLGLASLATIACSSTRDPSGPSTGIEIRTAPLGLSQIGDVCYDLAVSNGSETVWSRGDPLRTRLGADQALNNGPADALVPASADADTVCASTYGNASGGDIIYIGPCDATTDADDSQGGVQNTVTLWFDGIYNAAGTVDLGDWQDPCPGGCSLSVACDENADSLAAFNFTVMRDAQQGFFDIAVNFEDVFCSAKFDCQPELLHNAAGQRDLTGVLAFACATGNGQPTTLYLSDLTVACDGLPPVIVDPSIGPGQRTIGQAPLFAVGTYWGKENIPDVDKCYWNTALGLALSPEGNGNPANCHVTAIGTAASEPLSELGAPGQTHYPIVAWDVPITDATGQLECGAHPLNNPALTVRTRYSDLVGEALSHSYKCGGNPALACAGATDQLTGAEIQVADLGGGMVRVEVAGSAIELELPEGTTLDHDTGCCISPCCDTGASP